jgi:hypothetical protein
MILRTCKMQPQNLKSVFAEVLQEFEDAFPQYPIAFVFAMMIALDESGFVEITGDWSRFQSLRIRLTRML